MRHYYEEWGRWMNRLPSKPDQAFVEPSRSPRNKNKEQGPPVGMRRRRPASSVRIYSGHAFAGSGKIYRSTILLDAQEWNGWLAHCDPAFQYAFRAWSPEINKDLTYLALDRKGLEGLVSFCPSTTLITHH